MQTPTAAARKHFENLISSFNRCRLFKHPRIETKLSGLTINTYQVSIVGYEHVNFNMIADSLQTPITQHRLSFER